MNDIATPEAIANVEQAEAGKLLTVAQSYQIDSADMATAAADDLGQIKGKLKALDEKRLSLTRPLDEAKKRIMELFEGPRTVLLQAEGVLKGAILDWNKREQARLEAERREQERIAREAAEAAARQAEEARKAAEVAAAAGNAEAAVELEQQAEQAVEAATALATMAPAVAAAPAKLAGVSTRQEWDFEVTDPAAIPREYLVIDEKKIRGVVKALKADANIPGVRVFARDVLSARAK